MMLWNTVSTMTSECFLVRSETRETSSTSSAFVMLPVDMRKALCDTSATRPSPGTAGTRTRGTGYSLPLIAEVIAQRRRRAARLAGVGLPVRPVLVALEGPDAEADLALGRAQLDDLHLVGLVHLEVDLLAAVRVVELRHVNQP